MSSNADLLIELYPRLYHMAHAGSWPMIQRHGLLSTTALLDLFEIGGERRFALRVHAAPLQDVRFASISLAQRSAATGSTP